MTSEEAGEMALGKLREQEAKLKEDLLVVQRTVEGLQSICAHWYDWRTSWPTRSGLYNTNECAKCKKSVVELNPYWELHCQPPTHRVIKPEDYYRDKAA